MKHLFLLTALLLLLSCRHPVYYGEPARMDAGRLIGNTVRIYFDREGSLYPATDDDLPVDNERLEYHKGFIRAYHHVGTKRKWKEAQIRQLEQLQARYGLPAEPSATRSENFKNWSSLQSEMRKSLIERLNRQVSETNPAAIFIFIHGYNNNVDQATWYQSLRKHIMDNYYQGKNTLFIYVRWDGGTSTTALGIWGYAQHTMYPVGLALRHVLGGLANKNIPVRIFAHSTGCPLTAVTLWNSRSALSNDSLEYWGQKYADVQKSVPAPDMNHIRIAFLAPAMPASHFLEYDDRTGRAKPILPENYERLIVGHNKNDIATGKWILPAGCFGATNMGVQTEEYCDRARIRVEATGTFTRLVDFTSSMKREGVKKGHGVEQFMKAGPEFETLLNLWLADQPNENGVGIRACH